MLLNSWPVHALITRAARAYGFLDPVAFLSRMRGFAQPSEVAEPIELLRAGVLFHARGLVNTKAIQNNLDWIWPHWVERQFNPADESFIPRAFSFSHINLTHRNWTAVGHPDVPFYPIVDPRGLVTPIFDGWSLDFWLVPADPKARALHPSRLEEPAFQQTLSLDDHLLRVRSVATGDSLRLETETTLHIEDGRPVCHVLVRPDGPPDAFVAVALRPYNPEGISFVDTIAPLSSGPGWHVNARARVLFDRAPARELFCTYEDGDVSQHLHDTPPLSDAPNARPSSASGPRSPAPPVRHSSLDMSGQPPAEARRHSAPRAAVSCPVNMATAAALFPLGDVRRRSLEIRVPLIDELEPKKTLSFPSLPGWNQALAPLAHLVVPDERVQRLYDLASLNLVLHTPHDAYPGPYTYKRFWFRDAALMLNALVTLGGVDRARRSLDAFAARQRRDGYFLSQEGEWDSNGEALWIYHRYCALTGQPAPDPWLKAIAKGARWITRKRLPLSPARPEAGLLPAGFSAEHLGPNDFYYWDDFWGVAGLRCAAELVRAHDPDIAARFTREADDFLGVIERSFPSGPQRRFPGAIPASPKRRMDSGAVGSLVADYPLQLFAPGDPRILKTVDYLRDHSMHEGGFFQNMIHSGINAYLTLHLAQVRLRAGDTASAWALLDRVAELASPTGQWPEAIHPRTRGGCMGDGQHIWAAAEWLMMIRNCFVREERDTLVLGAGVKPEWWQNLDACFGPTLTPWGPVSVRFEAIHNNGGGARVSLDAPWRGPAPRLEFRLPGCAPVDIEHPAEIRTFVLRRAS